MLFSSLIVYCLYVSDIYMPSTVPPPEIEICLSISSRFAIPDDKSPYLYYKFHVPAGVRKVGLRLAFNSPTSAQIPLALYDPVGIRGILVNTYRDGQIADELWVAADDASKGGLPGAIPEGEWTAQLFVRRLFQETDFQLVAYVEYGPAPQPEPAVIQPAVITLNANPGWYKGELHCHSHHSTGETTLKEVVDEAIRCGYDYLAVTDHLTVSHWRELATYADNGHTLLIQSAEVAGNYGHANIHGAQTWVDPFVDRDDWSMNQVAEQVHMQGGLLSVNHTMHGRLGWRYADFEWSNADLYEIYCAPEGPNNAIAAAMWDHHLLSGVRLVGVGSTDSHDPFKAPLWKFGELLTWIYADELSVRGIIAGLKRGIVYVSKGPEIRFTAHNARGDSAQMWETLPLDGGEVTFEMQIRNSPRANLFCIKNGYPFDTFLVEATGDEWQTVRFQDRANKPSFYRLELHRFHKSEIYTGIIWRNHETMLALTNPIWVGHEAAAPLRNLQAQP